MSGGDSLQLLVMGTQTELFHKGEDIFDPTRESLHFRAARYRTATPALASISRNVEEHTEWNASGLSGPIEPYAAVAREIDRIEPAILQGSV